MYKGKMDINKAKEGHKHKYGTCKYMIINEHAYMILADLKKSGHMHANLYFASKT